MSTTESLSKLKGHISLSVLQASEGLADAQLAPCSALQVVCL